MDRLKKLVLNIVQSSLITRNSKLESTLRDVEEIKRRSTKRNASLKDFKTVVKKLKPDTMEDVRRDEKKLNRNTNPAIDLLKFHLDIP